MEGFDATITVCNMYGYVLYDMWTETFIIKFKHEQIKSNHTVPFERSLRKVRHFMKSQIIVCYIHRIYADFFKTGALRFQYYITREFRSPFPGSRGRLQGSSSLRK